MTEPLASSAILNNEAYVLGWMRFRYLILANVFLLACIVLLEALSGKDIAGDIHDLFMSFFINAFAVSAIAIFLEVFYRRVSDRERHISIADAIGQQNKKFLEEYVKSQNADNLLGLHSVQSRRGIKEIGNQIKNSKSRVWLLDWWEPNLDNFMDSICDISERVDIRIAIQDPFYQFSHRAHSVNIKDFSEGFEAVKNGINGNIITLKGRRGDLNNAKIRHFRTNIATPILIIDDVIYTGFYFHGVVSTERPQLVMDANEALGRFIVSEFANVWEHRCISEYELPGWVLKPLSKAGAH